MKTKAPLLIFSLFFVFTASLSFSQPIGTRFGPGMGRKEWRGDRPCWRALDLNLSSDQLKRLELIQQDHLRETQLPRVELFSKRLELREFLTNPTIKIESIRSKYLEINELESKLEEKTIEYLIKVKNLLTQEQLKMWCPEQEFPPFRRMMHGPLPMGPMHLKKPPFQEGLRDE